ncbi:MAG TPA: hypothetical protein DD381_07150 [Lentisphaeria bacterium]|nr:MAG: hypothetical protein A2X47_05785 [Lentisphaerae bacterium GWF2_38_69]HBM16098.1 hypothetical protein [Lentisphaeria bacterium]
MNNLTEPDFSTKNRNICIECGLCCDGSIYPNVFIHEDDDISFIEQFGFNPSKVNGELSSPLPCKWQKENLCTLYHDSRRLKTCKEYKCKLLEKYLSGEISYAAAIIEIKALLKARNSIKQFCDLLNAPKKENILLLCSFIDEVTLNKKQNDPSFSERYASQIQDCAAFIKMIHQKVSIEAFDAHHNSP